MNASQVSTLVVAIVLGLAVVGSYGPVAVAHRAGKLDFWVGMPQSTRTMFYVLQALAAAGFLTFLFTYCLQEPPKEGLFSYHPSVVPVLVTLVLLASLGWSTGVLGYASNPTRGLKAFVSICLVVVALASILLLAGYAESDAARWYGVLGLLLFSLVTVLGDGVAWNARWIRS